MSGQASAKGLVQPLALLTVLLLSSCDLLPSAPSHRITLDPTGKVRFALGPRPASLRLVLERGEILALTATQDELDIRFRVVGPGPVDKEFDLPLGRDAPEIACFRAEASGPHRVEISGASRPRSGFVDLAVESSLTEPDAGLGDCAEALSLLEEAADSLRDGDLAQARESLLRAEDTARRGRRPLLQATARSQLAMLALRQDRGESAEAHCDAAIEIVEHSRHRHFAAAWRLRCGRAFLDAGLFDRAQRRLLDQLRRARTSDDLAGLAAAAFGLGRIAEARSRAPTALRHFETALEIWRRLDQPEDQAVTMARIAAVHCLESRLLRAEEILEDALRLVPDGASGPRRQVLVQVGWVRLLAGRPAAAIEAFRQGIDLLDDGGSSQERADLLDRLASAERVRRRFGVAEALYREALSHLDDPSGVGAAHVHGSLGSMFLTQGRHLAARRELETAVRLFRRIGDANGLSHNLAKLGTLERDIGRPRRALERYRQAVATTDGSWLKAFKEGDLARPTSLLHDIEQLYVDQLINLGDPELIRTAFVRSDLARARNLVALLQQSAAEGSRRLRPPAPPQRAPGRLARPASEAGAAISAAAAEPRSETSGRIDLEVPSRSGRSAFDSARGYRVPPGARPPEPLDVETMLAEWPPRVALLSYVMSEPRSHLFVLASDGLSYYRLAARGTLESVATAWIELVRRQSTIPAAGQQRLLVEKLSRLLLGSIQDRISELDRLVVVAEGDLSGLPFGALLDADGRPLLESLQVVRGPSVGALAGRAASDLGRSRAGRGTSRQILVLADPVYSVSDPRCQDCSKPAASPATGASRLWLRLAHSRREARAIADLAPDTTRLRLDFEASRESIEGEVLSSASIVHFATHSWIDETRPGESGIVLSQVDARGNPVAGYLRLHDIQRLELDADLVVLSACKSAWAKGIRGDGLDGFGQAFFLAGARRLAVSLWEVEDRATADLMTEFYRRLLEVGDEPAEALRRAQLALRAREGYESPFFWAGFVLLDGWS